MKFKMIIVTPILNVSRKFSMCIIFSTGYIKIYNINSTNEYFIQQHAFVQSTIQHKLVQSIENTSLKSIISCSGYERALADYPSGYKLAKSC